MIAGSTSVVDPAVTERVDRALDAAANWLTARIGDDGEPAGAHERNSWWRVPWALALANRREEALAVLAWADAVALDTDGDLREGPWRANPAASPIYQLSPLAIAGRLLERPDVGRRVMAAMRRFWDPGSGGVFDRRDRSNDGEQDLLKTAQLGVSAVLMDDHEVADGVYAWIARLWGAQPDAPRVLYASWGDSGLLTDGPDQMSRFLRIIDFAAPRQAYFNPGIAAAFLADYALSTGRAEPLDLGRAYLRCNIEGTDAQYDDPESVQICKFGWGAAKMQFADPDGGHLPHVLRMADWFVNRQEADGAWIPAAFTMTGPPSDLDKMWKTAEHLMELAYIRSALTTAVVAQRPAREAA